MAGGLIAAHHGSPPSGRERLRKAAGGGQQGLPQSPSGAKASDPQLESALLTVPGAPPPGLPERPHYAHPPKQAPSAAVLHLLESAKQNRCGRKDGAALKFAHATFTSVAARLSILSRIWSHTRQPAQLKVGLTGVPVRRGLLTATSVRVAHALHTRGTERATPSRPDAGRSPWTPSGSVARRAASGG